MIIHDFSSILEKQTRPDIGLVLPILSSLPISNAGVTQKHSKKSLVKYSKACVMNQNILVSLKGHSMWNHLTLPIWHGFCLNFVRRMYLSKNKNPENFITLSCVVQKYDHLKYRPFSLEIKPLKFLSFWNCFYSAIFNKKHLKFGLVIHLHEIIPKPMNLAKTFIRHICSGELKLSKLLLRCFPFHFQRAISWQGKIQMC